ncbi:MAG: hypothetical protein M1826_005126, partial [Phylliscum demangeonii]
PTRLRSDVNIAEEPAPKRRRDDDNSAMPIVNPEKYGGTTQRELDSFKRSCENVFQTRSDAYTNETRKHDYAALFLTGGIAETWEGRLAAFEESRS